MAQKTGLCRNMMTNGTNYQNCRSTVGCYEKLDRAPSMPSNVLTFVVRHKPSVFYHTIRDGGCELVKCVVQGKWVENDGVEDLTHRRPTVAT